MNIVLIPDILRVIFETAATADRRTALKLALVSRRVQSWADRVLYSTVRLSRQRTCTSFLRTIETSHTKSRAFFATHVKSLCILFDIPLDQIFRIASTCSGIQNLTTWFISTGGWPTTPLAHWLSALRPTHLSAWHGVLCSPNPHLTLPFFAHITHLTVVNIWEEWSTWPRLGFALPRLTHLSLDLTFGARVLAPWELAAILSAVTAILRACPRLRVCGLRVDQPGDALTLVAVSARLADDVCVVLYRHREPFQVREAHSAAEEGIWRALETAVEMRRVDGDRGGVPKPVVCVC